MHSGGELGRERGASLVGVLVTLVILSGLSVLAVAALPEDLSKPSGVLDGATSGGDAPGGAAAGGRSGAPTAGASTAACAAAAQTVATAAATKHAADGAYPSAVAELVAGGWLASPPSLPGYDLTLEAVGGRPTGRILVNRLPADQGCAAGPRPGP